MTGLRRIVFAALLGFAAQGAAAQDLVANGSFESPAIGGFVVVGSMPGWALSFGTGFEIQNNVAGSPFAGAQHIELDGNVNSGMTQTVPTLAGVPYVLSVQYSPRPGVGAGSNGVEVRINGALVATLVADGSANPNTVWTKYSFPFTATGPTVIDFRGAGTSDGVGGYIDDVQVLASGPPLAVPAVSPFALGILALLLALGAGTYLRRGRASR
jgi:hypothetical protein